MIHASFLFMQARKANEHSSLKLLLVDDQQEITQVLKESIEPAGHTCVSYQNPRKALQRFKRESFDAVITDLRMPEFNGIQLMRAIREISPETPVVILTGYAELENAIAAVNSGAFAFLQKPVKLRELLDTLSRIDRKMKSHRLSGMHLTTPRGPDIWFRPLSAVPRLNVPLPQADGAPDARSPETPVQPLKMKG